MKDDFLSDIIFSPVLNWIWVWEMIPSKLNQYLRRTRQTSSRLSQGIVWAKVARLRVLTSNNNPFYHYNKRATLGRDDALGQRSPIGTSALLSHTNTNKHTYKYVHFLIHVAAWGAVEAVIFISFLSAVLRPEQTQAESLHRSDDCHKISCHKNWFEAKERKWRHTPK